MASLKSQHGMTLIEVLIASVILFIAIGTVSGIHRILNHYQALNEADYELLLNQSSFFDYLSYSLENNIKSGTYDIGKNKLVWVSKLKQKAPVVKSFDVELGLDNGFSNYGHTYLYDINYHFEQYPEKTFEVTKLVIENGPRSEGF